MPLEDPDQPEPIPVETVANAMDVPHAPESETTPAIAETTRTTSWETMLATARIRTKEELISDLAQITTFSELRHLIADWLHSITSVPAIALLYEMDHLKAADLLTQFITPQIEEKIASDGAISDAIDTMKYELSNPGKDPFDIHFNIPINDETKAKLQAIFNIIKMPPSIELDPSRYQEQIDLLETLYYEQEAGVDVKTFVDSVTARINEPTYCDYHSHQESAINFYRQLTPEALKNFQFFLGLNIPITFDCFRYQELNTFNTNEFAQIKAMTQEEIEIYQHLQELSPYTSYSEIFHRIRIIQTVKITLDEFKKCYEHLKTIKLESLNPTLAIDWIFFAHGGKNNFAKLYSSDILVREKDTYAGPQGLEDLATITPLKAIEALALRNYQHACPLRNFILMTEKTIEGLLELKKRFPKWTLKGVISDSITQATQSAWSQLDLRLTEIPFFSNLSHEYLIQALFTINNEDWLKIKRLLASSITATENLKPDDPNYTLSHDNLMQKFALAIKRLKSYSDNEALLDQDLEDFSLFDSAHYIECAIHARAAFNNDQRFVQLIYTMLKDNTPTRKINELCLLAPFCKHDFKRFQLILAMKEHYLGYWADYTDKFEIGPTEEDFATFIFIVITGHTPSDWNKDNLSWTLTTFPEFDFFKNLTPGNFLFFLGMYSNKINAIPADHEEKILIAKLKSCMETNKDKILKYLEDLRDQTLQNPTGELHKFKLSIIKNLSQHNLPGYRFVQRTMAFIAMFSQNQSLDRTIITSLFKKFEQTGKGPANINYSKTELIDFYEKTESLNTSNPQALPLYLKCLDTLTSNKENFALMQNQILKLLNIVSILSSSVQGSVNNWPEFFEKTATELEGQSPAKQKEILLNTTIILQSSIKNTFETGLGLKNLPELTPEAINELTPSLIYLANIHSPDVKKKAILSLFILLKILGKWDDFKAGKPIEVNQYLNASIQEEITEYLSNRSQLDIFIDAIPEAKSEQWIKTLEEKTDRMIIGETTSVADTLGNIERQNEHLVDEDNFSNDEKILFNLVQEHGQKAVGAALAQRFKDPKFENEITKKLPITVTPDGSSDDLSKLLPIWQKVTRILGSLIEFTKAVKTAQITPKLEELQEALTPSANVITIFQKLGEEMTAESGALPITDDIEHLEIILHKSRELLTPEEFTEAETYIATVKKKVMELNKVKDDLSKKFVALHEASTKTTEIGEIFRARLSEFKKIFLLEPSERRVTLKSSMTGDLTDVIPHIRQCLGCMTKECNNDTNLTFGDRNRFSIITREAGMPNSTSISDELVTVQKTIDQGATNSGYSFVMDNIYGKSSRDILVANVLVVMKKLAALQKVSAVPPIDIFVTQAALFSCGIEQSYLEKRLREESNNFTISPITKTVTIAQSASGDGHYEIGGGFSGRVSNGEGEIKGLKISLSS